MKIETRGVEGAIIGVAIGGFEITGRMKFGGIPETTTKVGKKRKERP